MVDYVPYSSNIPQDFELYSNAHEQQMEYHSSQPFLPSSTYGMEQTFSAPYDPMGSLSEAPRAQDLQFHYDAIAQGVKPFQYHTPTGSPNSSSHSFHDQPPVLSASSESGASVSSSAMHSPSLAPQFNESWNPMGLGLTSSFEYSGIAAVEKTFVGESTVYSAQVSPPSIASPSTPQSERHVFKTPNTPASASWSTARSNERRNSLLSNEVRIGDIPPATSASVNPLPSLSQSFQSCWFPPSLAKPSA